MQGMAGGEDEWTVCIGSPSSLPSHPFPQPLTPSLSLSMSVPSPLTFPLPYSFSLPPPIFSFHVAIPYLYLLLFFHHVPSHFPIYVSFHSSFFSLFFHSLRPCSLPTLLTISSPVPPSMLPLSPFPWSVCVCVFQSTPLSNVPLP